MCKRLSTCLLRLYPPNFRASFGEEYVQLCLDRWKNENGALRKARLICDLLVDSIVRVPRAWWVYDAQTFDAVTIQQVDGIPTFRMLERRSLHPGFVLIGSSVTISVLFLFIFVVNHTQAYRPSQDEKASQSPIESVIRRLNEPFNPGSGTNDAVQQNLLNSDASRTASGPQRPDGGQADSLPSRTAISVKPDISHPVSVSSWNDSQAHALGNRWAPPTPLVNSPRTTDQFRPLYEASQTPAVIWNRSEIDGQLTRSSRSLSTIACSLPTAQSLPGNVRYLNLNLFPVQDGCRQAIANVLSASQKSGAIILDLRDTRGGSPEMAALLGASPFGGAEKGRPPDGNQDGSEKAGSNSTYPPTYVLISKHTSAAAAQFAVILKRRGTVKIIGEFGEKSPYTGPESMQVVHLDVEVRAADALAAAEHLAAKESRNLARSPQPQY